MSVVLHRFFAICLLALSLLGAQFAAAEPMRVLWWDSSIHESGANPSHSKKMIASMNAHKGGTFFDIKFDRSLKGGDFAKHMARNGPYDAIIFNATHRQTTFNSADAQAIRAFYSTVSNTLMLDGTLNIRNADFHKLTKWPGTGGVLQALFINQMAALRRAGGGILVGTDHAQYQVPANQVVKALLPNAKFSRTTNPSRDGEFFGDVLLATEASAKPIDILRHWESIPNQGQAPVGQFTDFAGNPVTLYTLVEAADKPGGGTRRPYISSTINPGAKRVDIDAETAPVVDRMPTRKSPSQ